MELNLTKPLFNWKGLLINAMRTFLLLFCTTVFSFSSVEVFSQKEKVNIERDMTISVDEVFRLIMDQTDYKFIYHEDLFKNSPKVHLTKGRIKTNALLKKSLSVGKYEVNYDKVRTITIKVAPKVNVNLAQERIISGRVVDVNGAGIPGVNVIVGQRGTSTDFDGNFNIRVNTGDTISFRYVGFATQDVLVEDQTVINITLREELSALDEVVIVGYGSTERKDLTGTVSTIKAEEVEQIKTQSVERALYGKVPGVLVTGSGRPGSTASVIIRGLSQINGDNQPLYVIDGIPMNINANSRDSQGLLQSSRSNPLLAINPADIENVTILKDASAAGIYGSRAANGVIIITTKRGKRGAKPRFTFSTNATIQNPQTKYEFLSTEEYKDYYGDLAQAALDNSTFPEALWPFVHPNELAIVNDPDNYFGDANTNWQDEVRNKNAMWNDYRISLSGGTEKLNYFASANVQNQEAIFINSKFKRYSIAANLDADITDKLKVGIAINYNNAIDKSSDINNLRYPGAFRPDVAVFDEDGNYTDNGDLAFGILPDMNPVGQAGRVRNNTVSKNVLASIYAEYDIVKNLRFRSQFSANQSNDKINNFSPSFTVGALLDGLNGNLISFGQPAIGILRTQFNESKNIVFSNTLTYNNTFNEKHNLRVVAGLSWDSTETEATGVNFAGFPDDFILVNAGSATHVYNGGSDFAQKALNSFFGRINYNYDDRYLMTLTGRADRSTQFGENNRTGFFPSFGLAWNMHNESFLEDNETINQLKLRVSAGRTGNDNLPAFLFRPVMAVESSPFDAPTLYNGLNGFRLQGVSNQGIRWEETDQIDIGLELSLFNNRLNTEIVWFDKSTSDLILLTPISAQTGFSNFYSNIADVSNKGWEFLIGGDIFRTKDFTWNSSFNISFIDNNVDALRGGQSDSFNNFGVAEGYPLGQIFGNDILRVAQTQDEIDALNAAAPDGQYHSRLLAPGDFIARDVDGDGQITEADNVPLADGNNPDFFGGWNNTINYKNFDFTFNFQFVQGLDKHRNGDEFLSFINFRRMPNYIKDDALNAWAPNNPEGKFPRAGSRWWQSRNSRFVSDASYVSLRSASLGYNFPTEILEKVGISNAKLTLTGNNLFLIHNYAGPNPESVLRGVGNTSTIDAATDGGWGYPNVQSFTLGLNITF